MSPRGASSPQLSNRASSNLRCLHFSCACREYAGITSEGEGLPRWPYIAIGGRSVNGSYSALMMVNKQSNPNEMMTSVLSVLLQMLTVHPPCDCTLEANIATRQLAAALGSLKFSRMCILSTSSWCMWLGWSVVPQVSWPSEGRKSSRMQMSSKQPRHQACL